MSDYSLEIENLNFGYHKDKQILKDINLKLPMNKYICILGHNGSGKSTLSKLLSFLENPWSGSIKICGIKLNSTNFCKVINKLGLVFQNPDNQFVGLTPEDDIAFGLENRRIPKVVIKKIIEEVAQFLDITDILTRDAHSLSGGEKQKVAIASILAINPSVIIFDESTSLLDSESKQWVLNIMQELVRKEGKTVISITHDMEELLISDESVILKEGRIIAYDKSENLLNRFNLLVSSNLKPPFISCLINAMKQLCPNKTDYLLDVINEEQLIGYLTNNVNELQKP